MKRYEIEQDLQNTTKIRNFYLTADQAECLEFLFKDTSFTLSQNNNITSNCYILGCAVHDEMDLNHLIEKSEYVSLENFCIEAIQRVPREQWVNKGNGIFETAGCIFAFGDGKIILLSF